jgi:phosphate transport system permease protein
MSQLEKTAQAASGRLGRQAAVRNKKARENFMGALFMLCGALTVAFVLGISVYLVVSGLPAIKEVGLWKFLSGSVWDPANTSGGAAFGILPLMLTSVYGTLGASIIGVPVGIMTAVYLAKAAPPRVSAAVRRAVELLAGIPSVVYGLVGMIVLVPWIQSSFGLSSGACLAAAILVLAVMILPSIINVSATALQAVPREYEEASLALGATETETFFRVSLPAARSGVAASVVLGVGRAIGEAMAIIMVSGNVANMPGLFRSVRFLTTAIASGMSYAAYGSLYRNSLFSIGLVLFVFIMIINVLLNLFIKKGRS